MRNSVIQASLSDNGDFAYVRATNRTRLTLLDRQGRALQTSDAEHNLIGPRISPDGRLIVANELSNLTDRADLWLFDRESGVLQRLTTDGNSFRPQWTPDGRGIVYLHRSQRGDEILLVPVGHSASSKVLMSAKAHDIRELVMGPDLPHAVVTINDWTSSVGAAHIQDEDLGDQVPVSLQPLETNLSGRQIRLAISPDGRWLAYESSESGREEIYVRPFPEAGPPVQVTATSGLDPRWMPDSRTVAYRTGSGEFIAAHLSFDGGVPHANQHETLFAFFTGQPHAADDSFGRYDVGPDRIIVALQPATPSEIIVVQGWLDDVKRRARK